MTYPGSQLKPEGALLTLRIIHIVFIMSIGVYFTIIIFFKGRFEGPPTNDETIVLIKYVLGALGVSMVFASIFIKIILLEPERVVKQVINNAQSQGGHLPDLDTLKAILTQRFFIINMLSFALAESVAIYGLVIFFVTGDQTFAYGLAGLSFIALILLIPRQGVLDDLIARLERAQQMGLGAGHPD